MKTIITSLRNEDFEMFNFQQLKQSDYVSIDAYLTDDKTHLDIEHLLNRMMNFGLTSSKLVFLPDSVGER